MARRTITESLARAIFEMAESQTENGPASDPSALQPNCPGEPATSTWVRLPASILAKLREANRRTGFSVESLLWDAVDFYLEEKVYQWFTPDHPDLGEPTSETGSADSLARARKDPGLKIMEAVGRHRASTNGPAEAPRRGADGKPGHRPSKLRSHRKVTRFSALIVASDTTITETRQGSADK